MELIEIIREAYAYGQAGNVVIQPQESDSRFVKGRIYVNRRIRGLTTTREFQFRQLYDEHEITDITTGTINSAGNSVSFSLPSGADRLFLSQQPGDTVRMEHGPADDRLFRHYALTKRTTFQNPGSRDAEFRSKVEIDSGGGTVIFGLASFFENEVHIWDASGTVITLSNNALVKASFLGDSPTLFVPHYQVPDKLVNPTDRFDLIHDLSVIIFLAAADIAANNPISRDLYQNLLAEARDAFENLRQENRPNQGGVVIRGEVDNLINTNAAINIDIDIENTNILTSNVFVNSEGQPVPQNNN